MRVDRIGVNADLNTSPNIADERASSTGWFALPSLPDPIGYGGMLAGILGGKLVAGGGSQWDRPPWTGGGARSMSDRIFVLDSPGGKWRASESRLPLKAGHFAAADAKDAIYFAGGIGESGALRAAFKLEAGAAEFSCSPLPSLPEPVVYAASTVAGDRFYVIGGMPDPAAKEFSRAVWSLGLAGDGSWRREPDLPSGGRSLATAAGTVDAVYVFGGRVVDAGGQPIPSREAYRLSAGRWEKLPDLPAARIAATGPCASLSDGRILVAGGYADVFSGASREHPGFPVETFLFHEQSRSWMPGPALIKAPDGDRDLAGDAGPLPMIAAPTVVWNDLVVIVGGEARIATRTPAVVALRRHRQ